MDMLKLYLKWKPVLKSTSTDNFFMFYSDDYIHEVLKQVPNEILIQFLVSSDCEYQRSFVGAILQVRLNPQAVQDYLSELPAPHMLKNIIKESSKQTTGRKRDKDESNNFLLLFLFELMGKRNFKNGRVLDTGLSNAAVCRQLHAVLDCDYYRSKIGYKHKDSKSLERRIQKLKKQIIYSSAIDGIIKASMSKAKGQPYCKKAQERTGFAIDQTQLKKFIDGWIIFFNDERKYKEHLLKAFTKTCKDLSTRFPRLK